MHTHLYQHSSNGDIGQRSGYPTTNPNRYPYPGKEMGKVIRVTLHGYMDGVMQQVRNAPKQG